MIINNKVYSLIKIIINNNIISYFYYYLQYFKKKDDNPYVRKTAAICVAKLYDLNPQLTVDNGFVSTLQEMISDSNPVVSFLL